MTNVKISVNRFKGLLRRPDFFIGLVLLLAAFLLYARTMPPTVLDGDSGEFQFMASILGVPHSSGYPLYILIAKLFTFLPLGDVAFRVNLFSVICAAMAVPFVYAVAIRVIRARIPALLATLILAVTPSAWGAAIETKPYAFHFLLGVLALWFALRWHQENRSSDFYGLALTFGLGLVNHHVFIFTAPAFALVAWLNRARITRTMFGRGALLAVIPLLLYAYIPIRANQLMASQDPKNWELYTREEAILKGTITAYFINTPQGWLNLITGLDNSYKLGYTSDTERTSRWSNALALLLQQSGFIGLALAALGAIESFRRDRKTFWILLLYGGGVGFIALYMRALSTVYYFSLAYFILALWIGFGIDALMQGSARVNRFAPHALALLALALPINALVENFSRLDESQNYAARDYAQAVLHDDLGPNAVVIAPWEVSQPIRYFQFVENQRADMLVTNISPVWQRQFDTLLKNSRDQARPFYWVQFSPELAAPNAYRWVQAVPLPLLNEPRPRYPLSNAQIVPQVQVLGYDLDPAPPQPGKPMRVSIYYNARERMYPMYSSGLSVTDLNGKLIGEYPGFPATPYFPTYRWHEIGNYYRDAYSFVLPADAPAGLYNLDLSWYVYDLDSRTSDPATESKVPLGVIRVGDLSATTIAHAQVARLGDAITFLGWSGDATMVKRGQLLNLDLFWQTSRALGESYTVFVHLTDASGRVVADADSAPAQGLFPTNRWPMGEGMRDRHTLTIPAELQPGTYSLEIGMYLASTNTRLPITSAVVNTDKIVITSVNVQ